jgi:hypothetical protein
MRRYWELRKEHIENLRNNFGTLLGTHPTPPLPSPKIQKKKAKPRLAFSLAVQNFYFQNSLSPLSTWTNTLL